MKKRLPSLDGLRGFAALSVMLSHSGFNVQEIINLPITPYLFRIISSGTYNVQMLFVLSGFLMAYLYPVVSNPAHFVAKRYLRIMPIYAVIVVYLWFANVHALTPIQHVVTLLVIAATAHFVWKAILKLQHRAQRVGMAVFSGFVIFQTVYLFLSLFILPALLLNPAVQLTHFQKETLTALANLTHTTYFNHVPMVISGVFWSLGAELLFYIVYPFAVVPFIALAKQWKWPVALLIIVVVIKIILDIDAASLAVMSLQGMFLSRCTGFVIGVVLGTVYRSQGSLWQSVEKILQKKVVNIILLVAFFFVLGFTWPDRYHYIRPYVNLHFLGLSAFFGVMIAAAITPHSLINKIFSARWLTFLGLISYSLYLIHTEVFGQLVSSGKIPQLAHYFQSAWLLNVASIVISVGATVIIAFLLFRIVESLYFLKINTEEGLSNKKTATQVKNPVFAPKTIQIVFGASLASVIFIALYAGSYSPTLLMKRHRIVKNTPMSEVAITQDQPISLPFTAAHPNLSVVYVTAFYARDARAVLSHSELVFRLVDETGKQLFESRRHPLLIEGTPHFPFGFPPIADSAGKQYKVELILENATQSEEVFINDGVGMVTQYTASQNMSVPYLFELLWRRLVFSVMNLRLLFVLATVWVVAISTVYTASHKSFSAH